MYKCIFFSFWMLFICEIVISQDYSAGFGFLEKGDFAKAENYFGNLISDGNQDFTVTLCYARAIGLNGNASEANKILNGLIKSYPENYELKLNLAESYLWMKDPVAAKEIYKSLVVEDSLNFAAILGYANTLSALGDYTEAYHYILLAIDLNSDNSSAKISKKYIMLGYANSLKLKDKYKEALNLLNKCSSQFPLDNEVHLNRFYLLVDLKRYNEARAIKEMMLSEGGDSLDWHIADLNLDLILKDFGTFEQKIEAAQVYIEKKKLDARRSELIRIRFYYFLNLKKFNEAQNLLYVNQVADDLKNLWLADLFINSHQHKSLDSLMLHISDTLKVMEISSKRALVAQDFRGAKGILDRIGELDSQNIFKHYFTKALDPHLHTSINPFYSYRSDNGGTISIDRGFNLWTTNSVPTQFNIGLVNRNISQREIGDVRRNILFLGIRYDILYNLYISGKVNTSFIQNTSSNKSSAYNSTSSLKYSIQPNQFVSLFFNNSLYDYNSSLIEQGIVENRIGIKYYNGNIKGLGMFIEGSKARISDGNETNHLFLSMFKNFKELPLIQLGFNFNLLSYDRTSSQYFSQEKYNHKEVFLKFDNSYLSNSFIFISALAAFGMQDSGSLNESTRRIEVELGFKFGKNSKIGIKYLTNNASSATLTGYQVSTIGIEAKLKL